MKNIDLEHKKYKIVISLRYGFFSRWLILLEKETDFFFFLPFLFIPLRLSFIYTRILGRHGIHHEKKTYFQNFYQDWIIPFSPFSLSSLVSLL